MSCLEGAAQKDQAPPCLLFQRIAYAVQKKGYPMHFTISKSKVLIALLIAIFMSFASVAMAQDTPDAPKKDDTKTEQKAEPDLPVGVFYFYDGVDNEGVLKITKDLDKWSENTKNDGKPVRIVLCSPGGNVIVAFALIDEVTNLRRQGHNVTIADYGMAASAAGFILQSADTRIIGANSWILIHEISSSADGKLGSLYDQLKFTAGLQDQFIGILSSRSHLTVAQIHDHIDNGRDWWIPASEALKLGLVDRVEAVPAFKPLADGTLPNAPLPNAPVKH
ncbi:MAG TPA: ATP-dependent Clp protease proteolytic subunit [Planktothrix sp.]|jgi:ATP-dependent protease ClpP protease subunit